jgi:hypothetical protein
VQGGLTTTADASVNGVRVGKGGGTAVRSTAFGAGALNSNLTGGSNVAIGDQAMMFATGSSCVAVGRDALQSNTGNENVAIGSFALSSNGSASGNVAIGAQENLVNLISGSSNVVIGTQAGRRIADNTILTSADNTILIGRDTRPNANSQTNQIVIGHTAIGLGSNTTVLGNASTTHGRWYGSLLLGTTTNAASSILTMESTTQGFLPPRMTSTQRDAIASPATGLVVYQTDGVEGLYVRTSTAWRALAMV